jgi:diguanylate cyclase (GGDEF)-like protein
LRKRKLSSERLSSERSFALTVDAPSASGGSASASFDLSICARELIHLPGAIQPHGALLAVSAESLLITHASANLARILGRSPDAVLGQPLSAAMGEAAALELELAWRDGIAINGHVLAIAAPDGSKLNLSSFRSGPYICVDIEEVPQALEQRFSMASVQSLISKFKLASGCNELCDLAVRGLRTITGYDRVMAYRFAPDGHGEVIAEARAAHLEPYLGLHYPAADVPPQARVLYLRKPVGVIPDHDYIPVPIYTAPGLDSPGPLDLSCSTLRSVSTLHLQYMRNMNVAASTRIALPQNGKLWGIFVCHHMAPFIASPEQQAAAAMIGEVVSLMLHSLGDAEARAMQRERQATMDVVVQKLGSLAAMPEIFASLEPELLRLVDANGVAVQVSGRLQCFGSSPPPEAVERILAAMLNRAENETLATDHLSLLHPEFSDWTDEASGALVLPLSTEPGDAILWFRPEFAQTVTWGGNPAEHVTIDAATGRLTPRASFAAWKETMCGHSAPWAECDLALVRELRDLFKAEIASRTKSELVQLRDYDPLTGLANRRLLQKKLVEAGQSAELKAALLFIDLSQTKEVNDSLGYAAGDALLAELARRLVATVGGHHLVARHGGAELVVLCHGLDRDELSDLSECIRLTLEAPYDFNGHSCQVSPLIRLAIADAAKGGSLEGALDILMVSAKGAIEVRRKAEAQRQKMEGLGRMTGGIAHEINNLLQPITLLGQEILDNGLVSVDGAELLAVILDCSKNAKQIIGDLLAFSRPIARTTEFLDLAVLLEDTLRLVRQAIPPAIVIIVQIVDCPLPVDINRTAFTQILLNLATNAAAAMDGCGSLTITLAKTANEPWEPVAGTRDTNFVQMCIADTGCGMSQATLEHAFEPFFTTKEIGHGTGLGLSVVFGLVKEMGGRITMASEPDRGTSVTVSIPCE